MACVLGARLNRVGLVDCRCGDAAQRQDAPPGLERMTAHALVQSIEARRKRRRVVRFGIVKATASEWPCP